MLDREIIVLSCEVVLTKYIDSVITYYWIDKSDDNLIVRYLPLPLFDKTALINLKRKIGVIMNTAEDNGIFEKCIFCNLHGVQRETSNALIF